MKSRNAVRRTLLLLLVGSLAMTACGRSASDNKSGSGTGASAPGISSDTVTIGSSYPLSGALAANGTAAQAGAQAYFNSINDAGGVTFSDGAKRKINFVNYDDGYDPARAVQNYQKLVNQDHVFALMQTFGTAPNLAIMPSANRDQVPQLFPYSGAAVFSENQKASPWTIGLLPTYQAEGTAYAKYLVAQGKPLTVAVLSQADDLGKAYVQGLEAGIAGSQVQITARQTYAATDPTVDSQVTNLAATKPDVFFTAVAIPKLEVSALKKAAEIGWNPTIGMLSIANGINQVVKPAGLTGSDRLFTAGSIKVADDPQWANDKAVTTYLAQMKKTNASADPTLSNAEWGYAAAASLVKALQGMKEISRSGLMQAVHGLSGYAAPLLLPDTTLDGSALNTPLVKSLQLQKFTNGSWQQLPPS